MAESSLRGEIRRKAAQRAKAAEEADFNRIATILKTTGYRGYVALEYEAKEDALKAVPRYLDKLREALA